MSAGLTLLLLHSRSLISSGWLVLGRKSNHNHPRNPSDCSMLFSAFLKSFRVRCPSYSQFLGNIPLNDELRFLSIIQFELPSSTAQSNSQFAIDIHIHAYLVVQSPFVCSLCHAPSDAIRQLGDTSGAVQPIVSSLSSIDSRIPISHTPSRQPPR